MIISDGNPIVRALTALGLVLSAATFVPACGGDASPAANETEHVGAEHAPLTIPKQVTKIGKGAFDATRYGADAVSQIAGAWLTNVAVAQPATQSSLAWGGDPSRAVDGNTDGAFWDGSVTHTDETDDATWWEVDLGGTHSVSAVRVWNRTDCCGTRLDGAVVQIFDDGHQKVGEQALAHAQSPPVQGLLFDPPVSGRYVRVLGTPHVPLSLAEVEVFEQSSQGGQGVCWKKTNGRGVGTVPTECSGGADKDGALCYPPCAPGYHGIGPVCWGSCPPGYTDDGATCRLDASIISADNSSCPWYDACGLTFARGCSWCPAGYWDDGCTCRRDVNIIAKSSYGRGAGSPLSCAPDLQYDAGLCYTPCGNGYAGVGPVCWGSCPADYPVACGAACATSQAACAAAVGNMIAAPLNAVANITEIVGSFGTSAAAETGVEVAGEEAKDATVTALRQQILTFAKDQAKDAVESTAEVVATGAVTGSFDWASLDPTGIAEVVLAFDQPLCD